VKNLRLTMALFLLVLSLGLNLFAAETPKTASLKILKPADQAQLDAGEVYPLDYEVTLATFGGCVLAASLLWLRRFTEPRSRVFAWSACLGLAIAALLAAAPLRWYL
jgi:hypothetical protein